MNYNTPPLDSTDPLGSDLALDANGDLIINAQGDVQIVSGQDNVAQMIRVRLQTMPDSYLFGSDLGSDLGKMVDAPLNPPNLKLIEQYVHNALIVDSRISQINSIRVVDPDDGTDRLFVTVNVTIVGNGIVQTTVPIGGVSGV